MARMFNEDGESCNVAKEQVPAMAAAGWRHAVTADFVDNNDTTITTPR